VKGLTSGVVNPIVGVICAAILLWAGPAWFTSDLEYHQISINDYLSTTLGKQGLKMTYEGKQLKNVSVVDFRFFNRTSKPFHNVQLLFSVDDPRSPMTLVSSGIITPNRLPHAETVEELPVNDTRNRIFRLKVIPKQRANEYFHALFIFDGDKAPSMSVESLNGATIEKYQEWKDTIIIYIKAIGFVLLLGVIGHLIGSLIGHYIEPRRYRKSIKSFVEHAAELQKGGELKCADEQAIGYARTIYASFTRPKPHKIWSWIFGEQRFDD
jgi:hypothetical protein